MKVATTALIAGFMTVAGQAHAQSPADDVQCLVVSTVVNAEAKSEQTRTSANLTAAFYLGRIDGRISPEQLAIFVKAQNTITGPMLIPIFETCAQRAEAANTRLKTTVRTFLSPR